MRLEITIEYMSGKSETYVAQPPEWRKWEKDTGKLVSDATGKIGISDLLFLAYHAMKREAAGQPVKPIDIWCDTVANVVVDEANPKATDLEASGE